VTHARWDRIKDIFNAALGVPQADRPALLDRLCADDAELRREVESLLEARTISIVRTGGAADALSDLTTASITDPHAADRVGMTIHRYKLLQIIGEGGFGTVYLAEQTEPVRRRVALKVIKPGMDSRAIVARFEAERQALAMMDHPHIARVLDGGVTPLTDSGGGLPYFVMEYVVGDPVIAFADAHALSISERLDLFQQICSAVQHAHTKGIIHRDLKPGNVIVSMVDGKAFAKVIDFGIAKATGAAGGRLTDKTFFTEHRQLIGTPEYMSPEQAEGSLDIDTRTDVYALGVLLYELLTGTTPIDSHRLRSAAFGEMQRIIREEEPLAPSMKLSRSLERLASTAAMRKAEPAKLSAMVKGELDWIVLKALEKDRSRRYETATALADDVKRHMAGEPVVAAPPSRAYRLRKFARKNKNAVVGVSAVVLALAAGGSIAAWQWAESRSAKLRAEAALGERNAELREGYAGLETLLTATKPGSRFVLDPDDGWIRDANGVSDTQVRVFSDPGDPVSSKTVNAVQLVAAMGAGYIGDLRELSTQLSEKTDHAERAAYVANLLSAARDPVSARQRLDACPDHRRGWEWRYLSRASDNSDMTLGDGSSLVYDAIFLRNGELAATAHRGDRKSARIWNVRTGKMVADLPAPGGSNSIKYSDGGGEFLLFGLGSASVWDLSTLKKVRDLPINRDESPDGEFSLDGTRILTWSWAKRPQVWDARTGELIATIPLELKGDQVKDGLGDAALSADGLQVVTAHFDHAKVWDIASLRVVRTLSADTEQARNVRVSSDNQTIIGFGFSNNVVVWNAQSGDVRAQLPLRESRGIASASYSSDGSRILTSGYGHGVRVWDSATGRLVVEFALQKPRGFHNAAFSPDAQHVVVWGASGVSVFDAKTGDALLDLVGHSGSIWQAMFSPDGASVLTASDDGTARVWTNNAPKASTTRRVHSEAVTSLEFSPDGTRLLSATAYEWRVLDAHSGQEIASFIGPPSEWFRGYGAKSKFLEDGRILSWIDGVAVHAISDRPAPMAIAPKATLIELHTAADASEVIGGATSGGNRILTTTRDGFKIFDATSGELLCQRSVPGLVYAELSPGGDKALAIDLEAATVQIVDVANGESLYTLPGQAARFDPSGNRVLTLSRNNHGAKVWRSDSGELVCTLDLPPEQWRGPQDRWERWMLSPRWFDAIAFSPDGSRVALTDDDWSVRQAEYLTVFDTQTGSRVCQLQHQFGAMYGISFSPDGKRIATCRFLDPDAGGFLMDSSLCLWDADSGDQLLTLSVPSDDSNGICSIAWSLDGDRIAVGGHDGQVTVFDASSSVGSR